MTKMITAQQIKRICAMASGLHMLERNNPEDPLHILIHGMTGKCSLKELTYREALAVANDLDSRIQKLPASERPKSKRKKSRPCCAKRNDDQGTARESVGTDVSAAGFGIQRVYRWKTDGGGNLAK